MVSMDRKKVTSYRGPDLKIFVRDVRDKQAKKRPVTVRSWATVKDVKDTIQQALHIPPNRQRLYYGPLLTSGGELPNHRSLHDAGIYRSGETLLLDIKGAASATGSGGGGGGVLDTSIFSFHSPSGNDVCISSSMIDSTPRSLRTIVQQARRGFMLGLKPEFVLDGSGGTYFLHDARKNKVAVFKPADEEPYAENNPRGYLAAHGSSSSVFLREGVVPGEACIREVAAYLLDHGGTLCVPMTTLAEARHPAFNTNGSRLTVAEGGASFGAHSIYPTTATTSSATSSSSNCKKAGSFQEFVHTECSMDDISPSKISADEVHKIAILDMRIMNADRNAANLLVRRNTDNSLELIPIDHGFCLRSVCDVSWMDWCWLDWPQLKQPLGERLKKYVLGIDIEADARILQERLNICQAAIDNFRASSSILKAGVKAGLSLYQIALLCCRNDDLGEVPSTLERLRTIASDLALSAVENERWHHTAASRAIAEQLTPKDRSCIVSRDMMQNRSRRIHKSVSSGEFLSLSSDVSDENSILGDLAKQRADSPAMAQSSASDSSSEGQGDVGDVAGEQEECEEWAASMIADVSIDNINAVALRRGARSGSVTSDDSSDSESPKGFWYVKPDTALLPPLSDHTTEGSLSWSPASISRESVEVEDAGEKDKPVPPIPLRQPVAVDDNAIGLRRASVRFAEDTLPTKSAFRPATVNFADFALGSASPPMISLERQDSRDSTSMPRSRSYSALTQSFSAGTNTKDGDDLHPYKRTPEPLSKEYENYRHYFVKFIDLLIVRETTSAFHRGSGKMSPVSSP